MEELFLHLLAAYAQAELDLTAIVARYVLDNPDEDMSNETWANQKLRNIKAVQRDAIELLTKLKTLDQDAQRLVTQAYLSGASSSGVKSMRAGNTFIQTNSEALAALIGEYTSTLKATRFQLLRSTLDSYRAIIGSVTQQSVLGVDTRITTARRALAKFAGEGITAFTGKDGARLDMQTYTEMATRTAVNNSLREGKAAALAKHDLIIVRTSPRYCELCEPWKNTVLSLSGNDTHHPALSYAKSKGLFHPNCRCSFSAYIVGQTKVKDKDIIDNNYEQEQEQRRLERKVRAWKRRLAVADTDDTRARARAKIKGYQSAIATLTKDENLNEKKHRQSLIQAR